MIITKKQVGAIAAAGVLAIAGAEAGMALAAKSVYPTSTTAKTKTSTTPMATAAIKHSAKSKAKLTG
jgi:hypothetical protein